MAKNKITDLRDHLFETLEALKDPEKPMDLERAKVIAAVSARQSLLEKFDSIDTRFPRRAATGRNRHEQCAQSGRTTRR